MPITGPEGERIRFGCTPFELQGMNPTEDFVEVEWNQYNHLRMVEQFNTSGIIGAKVCNEEYCNLPSMIEMLYTTASSSPTSTTNVYWDGLEKRPGFIGKRSFINMTTKNPLNPFKQQFNSAKVLQIQICFASLSFSSILYTLFNQ